MENLALYVSEVCPYCRKVEKFMDENNIEIEIRDISKDKTFRNDVIKYGGMLQVPMLLIGDKGMYESSDIINYLKEKFNA
ncbi:MAG: glutathione S-transferase N-terminal domain-containing protein [Tissierellia bacterium]|nr:glutathione S-transferase N-terminal domain-containing protein [Tissierellia bacterium]